MTPNEFKRRFPAFQELAPEDVDALLEVMTAGDVQPGTPIISASAENDVLYLIVDGSVRVSLESEGEAAVLGDFGPGQWVGEMGLIEPAPGSATVTASDRCTLLKLSHADFSALRKQRPSLTSALLKVLTDQLSARLRATMRLVDSGEGEAGPPGAERRRHWFIEVAQRVMGVSARAGA